MENKTKIKTTVLLFVSLMIFLFLVFIKAVSVTTLNPFYATLSVFILYYIGSRIGASFLYRPFPVDANYMPSVTFIIPTFNEDIIEETIGRSFEVNYPQDKYEVIVINDGSIDNTWERIQETKRKYPQLVTINFEQNMGKREAMAAGMRKAGGDIVVQLDSDSFIEKNSLVNLLAGFRDKNMAAISAHTDPSNKNYNLLTKVQTAYYFVAFRVFKAAESSIGLVFCCSGCCSAFRREYLLPVIDEWTNETHFGKKMKYGEDRSLTNLLIRDGHKTAYSSNAQAYTVVPVTFKKFLKQQIRWKKSWIITTHRTAKYILKRDYFVGLVYLFPQMMVNYAAPFLVFYALLYVPIFGGNIPAGYIIGLLLLYLFFIAYYKSLRSDSYSRYVVIWGLVNILLASVIFPAALLTLPDNRWLTR